MRDFQRGGAALARRPWPGSRNDREGGMKDRSICFQESNDHEDRASWAQGQPA
jgi:hypothetical protein